MNTLNQLACRFPVNCTPTDWTRSRLWIFLLGLSSSSIWKNSGSTVCGGLVSVL